MMPCGPGGADRDADRPDAQVQAVTEVSAIVPARTLSKQVLQYTGRSLRGAKGTTACPPHAPHTAAWNSRGPSVSNTQPNQ